MTCSIWQPPRSVEELYICPIPKAIGANPESSVDTIMTSIRTAEELQRSRWRRNVALAAIVVLVFLQLPNLCAGHDGHDHHHHDEMPPSFKYSRQANEEALHHGHSHGGHGSHGHSHGGHEHDHHDHHDHDHHHHSEAGTTKRATKPELGKLYYSVRFVLALASIFAYSYIKTNGSFCFPCYDLFLLYMFLAYT